MIVIFSFLSTLSHFNGTQLVKNNKKCHLLFNTAILERTKLRELKKTIKFSLKPKLNTITRGDRHTKGMDTQGGWTYRGDGNTRGMETHMGQAQMRGQTQL